MKTARLGLIALLTVALFSARAQQIVPPAIARLMADNAIEFTAPDGYSVASIEKNEAMNYDFAIQASGFEARYAIRIDKNSIGDNSATNMAIGMNISKEKNPGALRGSAFPTAAVKKDFNGDAGGIYFAQQVDPKFNTKFASCLMMYLTKKSVGDVYVFVLFNEMNNDVIQELMGSVKFASLDDGLVQAMRAKDVTKVKELLSKGANPNVLDSYGQTVLHRAVPTNGSETAQDVELVKVLLAGGANPNLTSNFGSTALHTAGYHGLTKIAQALLDKGADPTVISTLGDGKTPIDMALSNSKADMAKLLQAQAAKFPIVPKIVMDTKATYAVDFGGQQYKFIIDIIQDEPEIVFNWKMTTANRGDKEGNISMSAEAVQSATAQYNLFENGEIVLDDKTSVWVSRDVFKSLRSGAETTMNAMGEDKIFVRKNIPAGTEVMAGGKAISVIYAEATDGSEKFWILNNPKMPLIMKMDLGWKIGIEKIE
jgi:Ankyrin repeats (3 copies)